MTERFIEQAEATVAFEAEMAVKQVQNSLAPSGRTECEDCGEEIGADRLAVAPFARRCVPCQQGHERLRPRR